MSSVVGFIGSGNMGQAMIGGVIKAGLFAREHIIVSDLEQEKLAYISNLYGVRTTADSRDVAQQADFIVLAVKPPVCGAVLGGIKDLITADKIIISIAAGVSIDAIEAFLGTSAKVVRAMPNTPALVNEAMSALCPNNRVEDSELAQVRAVFESFGKAEIVTENLIDSVTGVSGSSPAYVFMFIEALADAGVLGGMTRDKAYRFAAQAVLGAAKMALESGKHPGELKDMVCSPGGTTIEAVAVLEGQGLRAAVIKAAVACMDKSAKMGKR